MELVLPSERYAASFLAAEQELVAAGEQPADAVITAHTLPARLRRWEDMRNGIVDGTRVPTTTLWLVEPAHAAFIGRISIRHELNNSLRLLGGHIGYDVRPSRRRQGHGHRMLAFALPHAKALGIDPAMLTCDADNHASRAMIERAGGQLVEELVFDGVARLRFSLPTS